MVFEIVHSLFFFNIDLLDFRTSRRRRKEEENSVSLLNPMILKKNDVVV